MSGNDTAISGRTSSKPKPHPLQESQTVYSAQHLGMASLHPPLLPPPYLVNHGIVKAPGHMELARHSISSPSGQRMLHHERLPSVSQLLGSGSQQSFGQLPSPQEDHQNSHHKHHPSNGLPVQNSHSLHHRNPSIPVLPGGVGSLPIVADTNHSRYSAQPSPPILKSRAYDGTSDAYRAQPEGTRDVRPVLAMKEHTPSAQLQCEEGLSLKKKLFEERNIPGEGMCYVYEDGSMQRMFIGTEKVNPQWGQTKAGRPRKRMPVACIPCREKKIKCEPDSSRICVQCEKSGRECRYAQPVRGQLSGSGSPTQSATNRRSSSNSDESPRSTGSIASPGASSSVRTEVRLSPKSSNKRQSFNMSITNDTDGPSKRLRFENGLCVSGDHMVRPDSASSSGSMSILPLSAMEHSVFTRPRGLPLSYGPESASLDERLSENPYTRDPERTMHFLELYFCYVNDMVHPLFSRKVFMSWLQGPLHKPQHELMVVYAMMALGSVFSDRCRDTEDRQTLVKIARFGMETAGAAASLQIAQARCMLALYHFSQGEFSLELDFGGSAIRASMFMKTNATEEVDDSKVLDFGMNRHGLRECEIRTHWWSYMIDRYFSFGTGHCLMMQKEDVFTRFPCHDDFYDSQIETSTPYFDNSIIDSQLTRPGPHDTAPSIFAHLIDIVTICGDVWREVYRSRHRANSEYPAYYDSFYATTCNTLYDWERELPEDMAINPSVIERHVRKRSIGPYVTSHFVYHLAHVILNRRIKHQFLPDTMKARNLREGRKHAVRVLGILHQMLECTRSFRDPIVPSRHFVFATPLVMKAVVTATDVLSAAGSFRPEVVAETRECFKAGLDTLDQLSNFYAPAKFLHEKISKRAADISAAIRSLSGTDGAWICRKAMENRLPHDDIDLFYRKDGDHALLVSLGVDPKAKVVIID